MNEIRVGRLIIAGFITLIVFIIVELLVENFFEYIVFEEAVSEWYLSAGGIQGWGWKNHLVNIVIALLNTTILIWLYAALRPMFGVGVKTALITSLFGFVFAAAYALNIANIFNYPWRIVALELVYLLFELPVSIIAGATIYELD